MEKHSDPIIHLQDHRGLTIRRHRPAACSQLLSLAPRWCVHTEQRVILRYDDGYPLATKGAFSMASEGAFRDDR